MSEHQEQADDLEAEADQLKKRNEQLGEEIADLKEDWEAMRRDESVPGAPRTRERTPARGERDDERRRAASGRSGARALA